MSPAPSPLRNMLPALGAGALLVVCCALPVLLAAGILGALGGLLGSGWLLAAAGALAVAAVVAAVARHRRAGPTADTAGRPADRETWKRGE